LRAGAREERPQSRHGRRCNTGPKRIRRFDFRCLIYREGKLAEHTLDELRTIANSVTKALLDTGQELNLDIADLASVAIDVAGNLGFAAWNGGVVEQLRTAADVFERNLGVS
jgi:hypothetical protein